MPIKVCHLITCLNVGGAETMLYKLLKYSDNKTFENKVISLSDIGPIGEQIIKETGLEVISLGMKPGKPSLKKLIQLAKILKKIKPDLIQTWMYHSDLLGFIASRMAGIKNIVWGVHHSDLKKENNKAATLVVVNLCKTISKYVTKIVCCSNASYIAHKNVGYPSNNMVIIPNGFEMDKFKQNKSKREIFLEKIGVGDTTKRIIGSVGRWDVLKDYPNLIESVNILVNKRNIRDFEVLLCGHELDSQNLELIKLIEEKDLGNYFKLLGRRNDVSDLMASLDLFVLSSKGEGFPNVLGEAMASQTTCITTDVGDSAIIVGDTGFVVPPSDAEAIAGAIEKFLSYSNETRDELGTKARKRIEDNYKIEKIVRNYEELYYDLVMKTR